MGKRQLLKDFLSNITAFVLIYNFFAFFHILTHEEMPWLHLLLIVPFFFLFFLRKKLWNLPLFLIIHISFVALPAVLLSGFEMISMIGFSVICVIYSIVVRMKKEWVIQGSTAIWIMVYLAAIFIFLDVNNAVVPGASMFLTTSAAIVLVSAILFVQMENIEFSLAILQGEYKKPVNDVLRTNNTIIAVFLVIIAFFVIFSIFFPIGAVLPWLFRSLWFVVRQIVLLIFAILTPIFSLFFSNITLIEEGVDVQPNEFVLLDEEYQEQGAFSQAIESIVVFVASAIVLMIILFVIVKIIIKLHKVFTEKDRNKERKTLMPEDTVGKIKFILNDLKLFLPRFGTKVKHPLRKAYIKKVNGHIKAGIQIIESYTPDKIADKIRPVENIDELTQKYEEARYGRF